MMWWDWIIIGAMAFFIGWHAGKEDMSQELCKAKGGKPARMECYKEQIK